MIEFITERKSLSEKVVTTTVKRNSNDVDYDEIGTKLTTKTIKKKEKRRSRQDTDHNIDGILKWRQNMTERCY